MKKQKSIRFVLCAAMISSLSLPSPIGAGEVYGTVSKNMICNFNSESETDSWYNFASNAGIKTVMQGESGKEGAASLSVEEGGGKCSMAKNFRAQSCPFVLEFKLMPDDSAGTLTVSVYDRNSKSTAFLSIKDGGIVVGGKKIYDIPKDKYTKISALLTSKNKINIYIDENLVKKDIPLAPKKPVKSVTAVKFSYEAGASSSVLIDDVYAYEGSTLTDEFTLLNDDGKALYRTKNAAAFVDGFSEYCADKSVQSLKDSTKAPGFTDGKFYIPVSAALGSLGINANYDGKSVTAEYNNVKYTISAQSKTVIEDGGKSISLSAATLDGGNDILVCADDIASVFSLSKYFDGVDMYILSKESSIYKQGDDTESLSTNLKRQITNLLYAHDSTGRLVKIGSSLDLFKGTVIPVKEISAPYQPQEENPVTSAIDGNIGTRFAFDGTEGYFIADLGEVYDVEAFAIAWMNGHTRKDVYVMSYSTDGINWVSLPETQATGLSSEYQYHPLGIKARYIKYNGRGTIANDSGNIGLWNSVTEIVFFTEDKR